MPCVSFQMRAKMDVELYLVRYLFLSQGTISLVSVHHNSHVIEISFSSHPKSNIPIASKVCTRHDICAAVACAEICSDITFRNWITNRECILHGIWIFDGKCVSIMGPRCAQKTRGRQAVFSAPLWRHGMPTLSALLAFCEGNPPITNGFPWKRTSDVLYFLFCFSLNRWPVLPKRPMIQKTFLYPDVIMNDTCDVVHGPRFGWAALAGRTMTWKCFCRVSCNLVSIESMI